MAPRHRYNAPDYLYKNKVKVGLDSTANTHVMFVQIVKNNKNETETAFFTYVVDGGLRIVVVMGHANESAFRISNMCAVPRNA